MDDHSFEELTNQHEILEMKMLDVDKSIDALREQVILTEGRVKESLKVIPERFDGLSNVLADYLNQSVHKDLDQQVRDFTRKVESHERFLKIVVCLLILIQFLNLFLISR